MLILISTIMAFCMRGYEKSAISANIVKANENSTVDENTPKNDATNGITGDASNGQLPVTLDQNQLQSLDDYISNNPQNSDSETPKDEETTKNADEDGINSDEIKKQEEQNAEEEKKKEETKKDNRILKIQVGLIVALVLIASLVYFFGYDLLEPFIKID